MKKNIGILILVLFIFACEQKSLEFEKLEQFSKIDTIPDNGKPYYYKKDIYIVKNYKDNLQNERTVDSFAYKNRAEDLGRYAGYKIVLYKHSYATNVENLKKNPKDFDNYTFINDMIYIYDWGGGKWSGKMKFKGRETVEAQPMIRED
ncbi:hypothetical protein [Pedobacter xixiisoli]|uniref:Uncharacterized protein n=1 Tax=Pedobacter xixiisoli TaxID=1476464 RepID=A0A286AFB4_9SPHI|nr:hypothetical protein [Pedobacter xixiisoli]SOD20567.1 hypothetical protein SAMN06297358_4298 [Pedobacter xixiisoli]